MPGLRAPRWAVGLYALLVVWLVAGCGERVPQDAAREGEAVVRVVDAEGRNVVLPAPAQRVVSLVPSVTATIRALHATDRLVARTDFDTTADLADLPSVGGGLGPDLEALVVVQPDLVIRFAGDSDRATPARLDDLGIPHVAVRPDRVEDVFDIVDQVGHLLGVDDGAARLSARLAAGLDSVRSSVAGRPPVRTAYLMGGAPPWTAGGGTYIDELIRIGGGVNVFSNLGRLYGGVSPEVVATREIDVILLAKGSAVDERLLKGRTVQTLSSEVQIPGPDLVTAAWAVARALHPDPSGGGS